MLLLKDPKKMATTIVAKISKKPADFVDKEGGNNVVVKEVDPSKPETDAEMALHAAAADLIEAIKKNDEKAVHEALKAHYELCQLSGDDDDFEEVEEESE